MNRMKKERKKKENIVDSYKEFWYIYIFNVINVKIIKLMEIYTVFFGIDRDYQIIEDIYCFLG